ncbi:YggS family pyridoxal phosphate-dependent enzyme [Virgibacillus oceani]|uniref:Pyridoxal phosphate homeostasis protein n=1 Tax=Virgibacillus oceani TaxID=1479511 RepID=A0A917H764_9BACI|nr:YggS family pyridoxal phosphate-dependent enzyme [Virgibacillus oceani]GGG69689.1 YggS family pyridoxal phosphate enzyme [Virgibacillus oceani]
MTVAANLEEIRTNIRQACKRCNRNPREITIIGVTKYVTIERTEETIEAGIKNLGENRLEGLLEKYNTIQNRATWHFIGTLQSRKVKDVIDKVDAVHSLDRKSLAKEINKRAAKPINCFVQVNVSGEESKHGLAPEQVMPFVESIDNYENIRIVGLMTMAPHVKDEAMIRNTFRNLAVLRGTIQDKNLEHAPCQFLSMGMSNDYQIAIEEGATHIRIGSKLVGTEYE